MKKILVPGLALACLAAFSAPAHAEGKEAFGRLTVEQVQQLVSNHKAYLFDNNSKETWAQGHVPSAKWMRFDSVLVKDLPQDKAAELVFYCGGQKCGACHEAASQAVGLGYTNVFIMPDGLSGWVAAKKPLEKGNEGA